MIYTTLISAKELYRHSQDPRYKIVDCRFSLNSPDLEEKAYLKAHIPGAAYAHLERDLSGNVIPGKTGRHPLPDASRLSAFLGWIGIDHSIQVVAYDDAGGALAAARLWWLLRWLGHDSVAVLDGGWQVWLDKGYPSKSGAEEHTPRSFIPDLRPELCVSTEQMGQMSLQTSYKIIDVRSADRFRGENETIDPIAGHIPGAFNAHYQSNLDEKGMFKATDLLEQKYLQMIGKVDEKLVVFYCGSGVTACHSILAYQHARLGEGRLYAGSWSEWIASGINPVEINTIRLDSTS